MKKNQNNFFHDITDITTIGDIRMLGTSVKKLPEKYHRMKILLITSLLILGNIRLGSTQDMIKIDSANYIAAGNFHFLFDIIDTINDFNIDLLTAPKYKLGVEQLQKHIAKYLRFPGEIMEDSTINLEGYKEELIISFIIDKAGNVLDKKIIKGFHVSAEKDLLNMMSTLKNFEPCRYNKKPVDIRLTLKIIYQT